MREVGVLSHRTPLGADDLGDFDHFHFRRLGSGKVKLIREKIGKKILKGELEAEGGKG